MVSQNAPAILQLQMREIRRNLNEHTDQVVEKARTQLDWRRHAANHPWTSLSVALVAGYPWFHDVPAATPWIPIAWRKPRCRAAILPIGGVHDHGGTRERDRGNACSGGVWLRFRNSFDNGSSPTRIRPQRNRAAQSRRITNRIGLGYESVTSRSKVMIAKTNNRVENSSDPQINDRIREQLRETVARYETASPRELTYRLRRT